MAIIASRKSKGVAVQIIVITVLPRVELDHILQVFKDKYPGAGETPNGDPNTKIIDIVNSRGLPLRIAACATGQSGNLSCAVETIHNVLRFPARFAFLCGIAGNMRPDRRNLGDVIVPNRIEYRRYNRVSKGESLESTSDTRWVDEYLFERFDEFMKSHQLELARNNPYAYAAGQQMPKKAPPPVVEYEGCKDLCWDMVLDCEKTRGKICDIDNMIRAVEMEAEGFLSSLKLLSRKLGYGISGMIFRGLSDPASDKQSVDGDTRLTGGVTPHGMLHASWWNSSTT